MYSPRSNPFFNAYNFAHYEREQKKELPEKKKDQSSSSGGYELLSSSLKFPPIGRKQSQKDVSHVSTNESNEQSQLNQNFDSISKASIDTKESIIDSKVLPISNTAIISSIGVNTSSNVIADASSATSVPQGQPAEEDWEKQMKILEEVDILTQKGNSCIPEPLKMPLIKHIQRFPGLKRVPIYKLMEDLEWKFEKLELLLDLFNAVTRDTQLPMIDFLNSLTIFNLHDLCLTIFHKIISQPLLITEWVAQISREEGHFLIQVARHLPPFELQVMADNLLSLSSVQEMITHFHYQEAHRQTGKHCTLCRQKRMYNLQYRMNNNQVPKNTLMIPGLLSQYDTAEVWSADDERHYTFETNGVHAGQIFWQKLPVNLVEICDNCLSEAHKAITNKGRFDPIYQLDAKDRKLAMRAARDAEQDLSKIIMLVAKERKLRRLREFTLSALQLQGKGLKKEAEQKEKDEAEAKRLAEIAKQNEERRLLNEKAIAVDGKWKSIDHRHDMEYLSYRNRFALVQFHRGFNGESLVAPKERQHATTWRRQEFDEDGLPITAEAANKTFGVAVEVDTSHEKPMLDIWKKIADSQHAKFKERERLKEEERRRIAQENLQTLKDYIKERITVLDRQQDLMKSLQEEEEIRRQQQRMFEKQERRRLRWEEYLATERFHMENEDARSHAHRAYIEEICRENEERENMYNMECDQREIDRFWGLDYYEEMLREEEKRLRAFYQARIIQLNREMQKMGCVQPRRKKGDRETLIVPVEVRPIGSLPEEKSFMAQAADKARQLYMIKKLKAEEIRSQVKYRLKFSYA